MLPRISLAHLAAFRHRGMSCSSQSSRSIVLNGLMSMLFGQALLFGQFPPHLTGRTANAFCGKKPPILQQTSLAFSQVAVATMFASGDPGPLGDRDLVIWNISTSPYTPLNTDWGTCKFLPNPYYSDSRWNYQNLGDVMGVTLDDKGNIYLAATTAYGPGRTGALADPPYPLIGRRGQIYKIDGVTGEPTAFVQLPNWSTGAGLGNITFDSVHQTFYVSNFDDGLIYQLDKSGATVKTWDHGKNLQSAVDYNGKVLGLSNIPCPGGPCKLYWDAQGFAKLGRRPWAVRVYQNRLYYSIWSNDRGLLGTGEADSPSPNQIWSIALDAAGGFTGPERLEITMPLFSNKWSSPVSDLTFSSKGTMIVAERTMLGDHIAFAHNSRILEFDWKGSFWAPSLSLYAAGCDSLNAQGMNFPSNSAGGVDFDLTLSVPLGAPKLQVWATVDKMHRNNEGGACSGFTDDVYGLQGFPTGGGNIGSSVLIDLDAYTKTHNKTQLGGVRIPCPEPPPTGPSSQ